MDIMYTAVMIGLGIAIGLYVSTQIERGIDKRITKCKDCKCGSDKSES